MKRVISLLFIISFMLGCSKPQETPDFELPKHGPNLGQMQPNQAPQ